MKLGEVLKHHSRQRAITREGGPSLQGRSTIGDWSHSLMAVTCAGLFIVPNMFGGFAESVHWSAVLLALAIVCCFGSAGQVVAVFILSLIVVHVFGLTYNWIGMEVGKWGPEQWYGGVYWHENNAHLLSNIDHTMIPMVTLALNSFRRHDIVIILVMSVLGFGLGVQFLGDQGAMHGGASGVVCGIMAASVGALLRVRFAIKWFPLYLCGLCTLVQLMLWCIPILSVRGVSWEGHLGGAFGGLMALSLVAIMDKIDLHKKAGLIPTNQTVIAGDGKKASGDKSPDA